MTEKSESAIEAACMKIAAAAGWDYVKVHKRGYPDRLLFRKNIYVWVEFKRKNKKPRLNQNRRIAKIRAMACTVLVVDTVDGFEDALEDA